MHFSQAARRAAKSLVISKGFLNDEDCIQIPAAHSVPEESNALNVVLFQYFHDLFYLTPYFHTAFPLLEKMIVLDLDLEFRLQSCL